MKYLLVELPFLLPDAFANLGNIRFFLCARCHYYFKSQSGEKKIQPHIVNNFSGRVASTTLV